MNKLIKLQVVSSMILLAVTLLSCSRDEPVQNSELKVSNATAVTNTDMIGHWNLSGMIADTPVNLNNDAVYSRNLLEETDCFNTMSITFLVDGTFITNNAQMTFEAGASRDDFACLTDRMDTGEWVVRNDSLVLTMDINAVTYTHRKLINLGTNKFSFDITKIESNQYVDDPGNTQASSIRILELEYAR